MEGLGKADETTPVPNLSWSCAVFNLESGIVTGE